VADVNANIGVNIDTSDALAQLKNLQRQISQFHNSVAKSSESAGQAQRNLQKNFLNSVNAIEGFSAELKTVRTTAESFSNSLEKNKLSMREYFRFAASQTKTFGKNFGAEFSTIEKTAIERVKTMQTQYIKMGRDAQGAMQSIAIRPTTLNMKDLGTQTAIAAQKQVIFNQLVKQGSTNLLNFGKNTQWAGRQLMVGFTLPLATLGLTAGRVFMDMEKAAIKFKKVYGDLFTAPEETEAAMDSIVELGKSYTRYGVAVSDALDMAADAAAAGFAGADLQNQTAAALKLSVLGQLELNKALETTISLQNAFGIASADLAGEIDFLNAVENQTVISLDDITEAIPRVAPVVKALGGDVRDLAFFMAAMKEGGVNAAQGANALKSGLASLINPTDRARAVLSGFGVNLRGIIDANKGDVSGVVVDFAKALDTLDPMNRAQAIEQLFGKFQFARMSTLFANVAKDGTQASRVLDLAGSSLEELADLSEGELGVSAASSMNKFLSAVENIKLALAPIGKIFLDIATPIVEFGTRMLEAFNNLPDGIKKSITTVITIIGGIGPIALMTFGLINNGIANMIKFFATVRLGYLRITGQAKGVGDETQYMTNEQLEAAAAAASLDQAHSNLTQRFTAEKVAVDALRASYEAAVAAGNRFAMLNPGMMKPGRSAAASAPRMAKGGILKGPGNGTSDSILSWLSNGEAVIPAEVVEENSELIKALIAGGLKIPGFARGTEKISLTGGSTTSLSGGGVPFALGNTSSSKLGMSSDFFKSDDFTKMFSAGAIGAAFRGDAKRGEQISLSKLTPYLEESEQDLKDIVEILRRSEESLTSAGKNIESFDQITANAKTELEKKFADMSKKSERSQKVANAVQREMLDPTKESISASKLSENRARAVKVNTRTGEMTETVFRTKGTPGRTTANAAANALYPQESARLAAAGGTFAHLNEKRLGGKSIPFSGGVLAMQDQAMQQAAIAKLQAASATQAQKYPEGQLLTKEKAKKQGQEAGKAFNEGAKETAKDTFVNSRDRNSPHRQAAKDGSDDGKAYSAAFQEEASDATAMAKPKDGPRRVATKGNVIWDAQSKQYQEQAKMAQITESRQKGFARATQMSINKVQGFTKAASGASFAIAGVAGIATMAGGKVGEFAGVVLQLTGLFGSLMIVTSQLIATERAKLAMSMVKSITTGKLPDGTMAPTKGFRGGAKGMAGLQNVMKNVGSVFARLIPGLGLLAKGIAAVVAFLGGPLTIAIAALIAIFVGGVVAYKMARDSVTKLGETANLSAEKMSKLADIFGVTTRSADFAGGFSGTTAKNAEDRDKVTMVLESENFEKDFKTQISAINEASEEDAQRVLNSLAIQLSSSGFEGEAVEAIINAIAIKAERKDLDLTFSSISFSSPEGLAAIDNIANQTITKLQTAFAGRNIWDNLNLGGFSKQLTTTSAEFTTAFEALQIGFREGEISAKDLITSMGGLNEAIMALDPRAAKNLVDQLSKDLGMEDNVKGLDNFEDKLLLINARTAEIEIPEKVVKALERASKAGASKKDLQDAVRLRKELNDLIAEEAEKLEEAKNAEEEKAIMTAAVQDAKVSIEEEITALQNEATAYDVLMEAGWDAASAIEAVSDATIATALAMAATAEERDGILNDLSAMMALRREAESRKAAVTGGGGGGGGSKSPMQEALESLGKQRTEIKNNIAAYASLRKAGFSAAEAATTAADATLAAALASTKVGSSEWKKLVNQIRLVRVEALKTSEGLRNAFDGLSSQADEYYNILERQVERKYADGLRAAEKQATALTRAIEDLTDVTDEYQEEIDVMQRDIEIQFDRPIEALNEETSDLANDLSLMDRVADKITKRYDEQAEALERVNKINQRIIAQQKQQVGLSSALVEGDISAAAAAVQDIRASNAEAAGQSQVDMLNTAKQAELDALRSESGMSRLEIEERQFEISQEIYDLEEQRETKLEAIRVIEDKIYNIQQTQIKPLEKQLKANEDMVQAIEDQRDAEIEAIDAQRQKWEDAGLALDLAEVKAGKFNDVIDMAKKLTGDVVADWESLEDQTRILTIETVLKGIGGEPTDAPIVQESGGGGGGGGQRNTPGGDPVVDDKKGIVTEPPKADPFGWLEDSLVEVGSWWDSFVNQPWVKSLAAMAIGTYNVFIKPIVDWITEQWNKFAAWFDTTVIQPIKTGWDSLTKTIDENVIQPAKQMWADLNAFVDTKITEIGEWWNGLPLVKGFEDFFAWFNKDDTIENKIKDVEGWWKGVGENIGSAWEDGIAWFKDLPNKISRQAGNIWGRIQGAGAWLATQGENFNTWITEDVPAAIAQGGEDLWNGMQGIGDWLGEQLTNFQTWLIELPGRLVEGAAFTWTFLGRLIEWLGYQLDDFQTWLTTDVPQGIATWGAEIWQDMQNIGDWLTTQWENFMTWMTVDLPAGIAAWGAEVWQDMQDVGEWLATQWENFRTWATVTLPNGIRQWGANTWANIQNIGQWLATQFENFRTWLTVTLPNSIREWGANTWANIQNIGQWLTTQFENFRTWLTVTLPNGIVNWARNLWTNGLPTLGNWLAARATELQNWFRDLPGRIAGWAGNLFGGLGDWLQGRIEAGTNRGNTVADNTLGPRRATGGMIYRNAGGDVPGEGNMDTVPAMLTPGEYVINKRSTAKYRPALKAMNAGTFGGGMTANRYKVQSPMYSPSNLSQGVYSVPSRTDQASNGNLAMIAPQSTTATQFDNPVYNYSLSVNVNGSNASANDIASTVMDRIKRVDSQRLRKQVIR
jgi:TP901 family phage tail tape measure protein